MNKAYTIEHTPPTDDALRARFRPIFERIAEGAVEREQSRSLPYEPVRWLREAGFGALRVPQRYGGIGATLPQFFGLLLELATADSNISHLLRGHFAFLEAGSITRRRAPASSGSPRWWTVT